MIDSNAVLESIVSRAWQIYSLPRVAVEVLELTNHPQVDIRRLKECIENDPALTGKILRVVNSSLFGLSCEVKDLNQALALMGTKPLKLLVLGFSLPDTMFAGMAGDLLGRFWRHTLTRAVAARKISQTIHGGSGDEPFIAGLLRDLGQLVLLQELGEPYAEFWRSAADGGGNLTAMERHSLGFDHVQLTARLLEQWKMPRTLVDAVAPPDLLVSNGGSLPESNELQRIVQLAELISQLLTLGRLELMPEILEAAQACFRLDPEALTSLVASLQERVAQLADILSLKLPCERSYEDVLLDAHSRLSNVAADAAEDLLKHSIVSNPDAVDSPESQALGQAAALLTEQRPIASGLTTKAVKTEGPSNAASAVSQYQAAALVAEEIDDRTLLGWLTSSVAACRSAREPLSMLIIELEGYADAVFSLGSRRAEELLRTIEETCREIDHDGARCIQTQETRFALVLPNCERPQAVRLGTEVLGELRKLIVGRFHEYGAIITVNVGAATVSSPPKNFLPQNLIDGAGRCLYAARSFGGDSLKSIEIY